MHSDAQTFLETLFRDRWTANTVIRGGIGQIPLRAPTQFENVQFDSNDHDYIYRVTLTFGQIRNIGLGATCQRHTARLDVHLFHKPGSGLSLAMKVCDDIVTFFMNTTHSIYEFLEPSVRKIPVNQDGWVQVVVSCPFEFDTRS